MVNEFERHSSLKAKQKARAKLQEEQDKLDERKRLAEEAKQADMKRGQDRLRVIEEEERKKERAIEYEKKQKEHALEEARTAEERKPDAEKIREFAEALRGIKYPAMKTEWGQSRIYAAKLIIDGVADSLGQEL